MRGASQQSLQQYSQQLSALEQQHPNSKGIAGKLQTGTAQLAVRAQLGMAQHASCCTNTCENKE